MFPQGGMGLVAGGPGGMGGGGMGQGGGMPGIVRDPQGGGGMGLRGGGSVVTPPFNPNDIAGTQGGRRPLPEVPSGGFGTGSGEPQILNGRAGIHGGQVGGGSTAPTRPASNQWEGWDFVKQGTPQGGGLVGLSNQAAGSPMDSALEAQWRANNPGQVLPDQSNDTPAPFTGLKNLANQSKRKPTRTLAQTYRPNSYGVHT